MRQWAKITENKGRKIMAANPRKISRVILEDLETGELGIDDDPIMQLTEDDPWVDGNPERLKQVATLEPSAILAKLTEVYPETFGNDGFMAAVGSAIEVNQKVRAAIGIGPGGWEKIRDILTRVYHIARDAEDAEPSSPSPSLDDLRAQYQ
jgi:hypothetical protein